jgi:hypothetical protein
MVRYLVTNMKGAIYKFSFFYAISNFPIVAFFKLCSNWSKNDINNDDKSFKGSDFLIVDKYKQSRTGDNTSVFVLFLDF